MAEYVNKEAYTGKIKLYKKDNGYGFIKLENERDVFFHVKRVICNPDDLNVGMTVAFKTFKGKKGVEACDVEIIS